jgi:hypothetical protein
MYEILKPPLPFVIFIIFLTLLSIYNSYQAWANIQSVRQKVQKTNQKLPNWYPLRDLYLKRSKGKGFILETRIVNSCITFTMLCLSIVLIVALFIGH